MNIEKSNYTGESPVLASSFDRLGAAVDDLRGIQKYVGSIADRIAGSVPPENPNTSKLEAIGGGGLIDSMERSTAAILGVVNRIREDMGRIENRL